GRVVAILAWCVFGTAALGAVVVGVAPNWTSSFLHTTSVSRPGQPANDPTTSHAQSDALPPASNPDDASAPLAEAAQGQTKPAKPKHPKPKRTPSSLTANPPYWGLPAERSR